MKFSLAQLNQFPQEEFVRVFGGVFEHSPWIAAATWAHRPFVSVAALHQALCDTVRAAGEAEKLALVRAHPDLVGRAALAGTLTRESTSEQASAGLGQLTAAEVAVFQEHNAAYQSKFGFPFVICARLNKKAAILQGFELRRHNSREQELATALGEIFKIAELRLHDLTHA